MRWTMVGALGELFGAIAAVASLLYVGHQVRQNNRIARAEAYRDVTFSWARMFHQRADDPQSSKVFMDRTGARLADLPEDVRNAYLLRHAAMASPRTAARSGRRPRTGRRRDRRRGGDHHHAPRRILDPPTFP